MTEIINKIDSLEQERQNALMEEMGITTNEADKLRGMMMDSNEAVAMKSEQLTTMRQSKGYNPEWEERANAKARMGRVMHHSEFLRRLRLIVPDLIETRARVNGQISLYRVRNTPVNEAPDYVNPYGLDFFDRPDYIGWIHEGEMPEYEIDIVNDAKIPISQKRGWRTILLRMIVRWDMEKVFHWTTNVPELVDKRDIWGRPVRQRRASVITEAQALEAFGYPTQGITSSGYRQQLHLFRNAVPDPIPDRFDFRS